MRKLGTRVIPARPLAAEVAGDGLNTRLFAHSARTWELELDWSRGGSEVALTTVSMELGKHVPLCEPDTEFTGADTCPDCFRGKLMPWLESQKVAP